MKRQSDTDDLYGVVVAIFIAAASIIYTAEVFAQNTMKFEEPKKAYASLNYTYVDLTSAPKVTFGYDLTKYLSGEVSYLQSGYSNDMVVTGVNRPVKKHFRSTEAALITRPFAGTKFEPAYLKLGVASDVSSMKIMEIQGGNVNIDTPRTALVYGGGLAMPIRMISKDLFADVSYSRHEYFQSNVKPVDVFGVGLKVRY